MSQLNPFVVLLHDPELRRGIVQEAKPSSAVQPMFSVRIRVRSDLARVLRGLAARVEPSVSFGHLRAPGGDFGS